jgi:glucuronate isomerase
MGLSKLDTTIFDDLSNQVSVKILSSHHELFAVWKEKNELVMQVHFCKQDNKIKSLEGSLGMSIGSANITEEQKITRCYEALTKVIMTQKSLANIKKYKDLISRNQYLMSLNQKLIDKNNKNK